MPLPSSSLVAIQDQVLVAKNNNNLVAPLPPLSSPPVLFQVSWSTEGPRVHNLLQVGLSGCFSSHSAPSARAAAAAGCAGHLRRGLMAQSAGVGAQQQQPVHIAFTTFFQMETLDGNDSQRGL